MNTDMYHRQVAILKDGREGNENTLVNKIITASGCCLQFNNRAVDITVRAGVTSTGVILYCVTDLARVCELPANQVKFLMDKAHSEKKRFLPPGRGCRASACIEYDNASKVLRSVTTGTLINTLLMWLANTVHPYMQDWLETQGDDASCFELDSKCMCVEEVKPKRKYTRRKASEDVASVVEAATSEDVSSDEHEEPATVGQQAFSWFTSSNTSNSSWMKKEDEIPTKSKAESSAMEDRISELEKEVAELKEFIGKLKAAAAAINM